MTMRLARGANRATPPLLEIFRAQLDRRAVRGAVGGVLPGAAITREAGGVGDALFGDQAFERGEPVPVIGLAGIGIARLLRALDLGGEGRCSFGPAEQPAPVERQGHREGLRFPRLAEYRAA